MPWPYGSIRDKSVHLKVPYDKVLIKMYFHQQISYFQQFSIWYFKIILLSIICKLQEDIFFLLLLARLQWGKYLWTISSSCAHFSNKSFVLDYM